MRVRVRERGLQLQPQALGRGRDLARYLQDRDRPLRRDAHLRARVRHPGPRARVPGERRARAAALGGRRAGLRVPARDVGRAALRAARRLRARGEPAGRERLARGLCNHMCHINSLLEYHVKLNS